MRILVVIIKAIATCIANFRPFAWPPSRNHACDYPQLNPSRVILLTTLLWTTSSSTSIRQTLIITILFS